MERSSCGDLNTVTPASADPPKTVTTRSTNEYVDPRLRYSLGMATVMFPRELACDTFGQWDVVIRRLPSVIFSLTGHRF